MRAELLALVQQNVRDDSGVLSPDDYDAALTLALSRYSSDRPRYRVEDLPATGSDRLNLPSGFQLGISSVTSVEYPLDAFPPECLDNDQYLVYQAPDGWLVRFAFAPTSEVRVTYSVAHHVSDTEDTVPIAHREAVACWAAASGCDQLASHYANASDSTIQADRVDRQNQSRDYAARAKALRARYLNELGVNEKKAAASGVIVDIDLSDSLGQDRFIHGRRTR